MDEQHSQGRRPRAAEIIVFVALLLVTMSVNLSAPLYAYYEQSAGYGNGLTATVFALYVVGLLPTLFFLGGISDYVDSRTIVLCGLAATTVATLLLIISPTIYALMVARVLHGIGLGLSLSAATAFLVRSMGNNAGRVSLYVSVVTVIGFGSGPVLTSLTILSGETLVPFSYWAVLAISIICGLLVFTIPVQRPSGGVLLRLPYIPRAAVLPGLIFALAWSLIGLVMSIIPILLAQHHLTAWSGVTIFCVSAAGALCQITARRLNPAQAQRLSVVCIPVAYLILWAGMNFGSVVWALAGAVMTGVACFGLAYPGGLAEVIRVGQAYKARAVSGYLLCGYLGFALPSIVVGFLADRVGMTGALAIFGTAIIAACGAILGRSRHSHGADSRPAAWCVRIADE